MVSARETAGARNASKTRSRKGREQHLGKGIAYATWQAYINTLLSIKDNLQKEGGRGSKVVAIQGLEQAIQQAHML